ncbi:Putative two-component response regulator [hydrothermal vent metagenome]|uniref:Putative two-component response regulator n=1 Tax=hydrothermal vent metagenome TaxID=652676 RepID=A0A1W1B8A5_9ZZZZ
MTLLYAEDEEITRKNYANYMARFFDEVYEAGDGKEALEIYEVKRPDILLLDIDMPCIDGLEVASRIREKDKKCRIIMLTAIKDVDKLIFATELNLTKYLPKPINRKELKDALFLAKEQILSEKKVIINDTMQWDKQSSELYKNHQRVKLTKYETRFFKLLMKKPGHIYTQEEIITFVWGEDALLDYNPTRLKDLVKRVRRKLTQNCIENIYSQGYRIILS